MTVEEFIHGARLSLVDDDGTHWSDEELIRYIDLGYSAIVAHRPDAHSKLIVLACEPGPMQIIPQEERGAMLLTVKRNLILVPDSDPEEYRSGRPPRLISGDLADNLMDSWYLASPSSDSQIDEYIYDDRLPDRFYVYPNATSNTRLELAISTLPNKHDPGDLSEAIQISPRYISALNHYVLFKAYTKDAQGAHSEKLAMLHLQSFNSAMGIKTQVDYHARPAPMED